MGHLNRKCSALGGGSRGALLLLGQTYGPKDREGDEGEGELSLLVFMGGRKAKPFFWVNIENIAERKLHSWTVFLDLLRYKLCGTDGSQKVIRKTTAK